MVSIGAACQGKNGKYKITKHIASGGMGHVYEAFAANGREVIIKVPTTTKPNGDPLPPVLYDAYVDKLKVESKILKNFTAFTAPSIVKYMDESRDLDDFFLVTEKIHGKTLSKTIPATGLPEKQLISMSLNILRGLEFIHQHNTVYRDMKPDNIMVQNNGSCIIIDFGGAKQGLTQTANSTNGGTTIHTPGWSCPHQEEGRMSAECDLYAFGRVMFYMGTMIKPKQLQDQLGQMTKRMRDVKSGISLGLSDLVDKTLDSEHNTIHTTNDMMTELRRLSQHAGVQQQPRRLQPQYRPRSASSPAWRVHRAPHIVLQGVEYKISALSGGSLIGKKHNEVSCQKSGGGCNQYNQGRNIFVGWDCPTGCRCEHNPGHMIDKHHMRLWRDNGGDFCVVNNDQYRRSAINRKGRWNPMSHHRKVVLKDHDRVALLYNERKRSYMEFTFYER